MSARKLGLAVIVAVGAMLAGAGSASAVLGHVYTGRSFGPGPLGSGSFVSPQGLAVDDATGDVYVFDAGAGAIYKFNAAGEPAEFSALKADVINNVPGVNSVYTENQIAVDNSNGPAKGDIYVTNPAIGVQIFSEDGEALGSLTGAVGGLGGVWGETCGVAVDAAGHVYVSVYAGGIDKYTPTSNPVRDSDYTSVLPGTGSICNIAADSSESIYTAAWGANGGAITKYEAGASLPVSPPFPASGKTLAVDLVNDNVYVDQETEIAQYEASGALRDTFGTPSEFVPIEPGALSGSDAIAVNDSTGNPSSGDVYATSGGAVEIFGPLVTLPGLAPTVEDESAADASGSSVTFQAQVNPRGEETTYHFAYVTDAGFKAGGYAGATLAPQSSDLRIAAGTAVVGASVHVQGLLPDTTYHYRVIAGDLSGTVTGADQTFTTQSLGAPFVLPDGRQYEMVSPVNKYGTETLQIGGWDEAGQVQASEDGTKISYVVRAPATPTANGNPGDNQVLSTHGSEGWETEEIGPVRHVITGGGRPGYGSEYKVFSTDLSLGLLEPQAFTQTGIEVYAPEAPPNNQTAYLRNNTEHSFRTLVTAGDLPPTINSPEFVGASPDLGHIVFAAEQGMIIGGATYSQGLFEWAGGRMHPVSLAPNGSPPPGGSINTLRLGGYGTGPIGAVSSDGSNTIWSLDLYAAGEKEEIYDRDVNTEKTVLISEEGRFEMASDNASKVFYLAGENLFEYDSDTNQSTEIGKGVGHAIVLGTSADGAYVYYENGASEVMLYHEGTTTSIATTGRPPTLSNSSVRNQTSHVSPNGRYLAFMSLTRPTGYDNLDQDGAPVAEVYIYDATTGRLSCASCNPTGSRPVGVPDGATSSSTLYDPVGAWKGYGVSGMLSPWESFHLGEFSYLPRALSDEGQLFFDSADALVPRDTNGTIDAYEYESVGVGSCSASSETYSERSGGCISLISSGTSREPSLFLDASASGNDVFFRTAAQLLPQDFDHVNDVYDAHVCSAEVPCYPVAPLTPPACTSGDGCRPSPSPQPPVFGAPSSETFSGAGNVVEPVGAPVVNGAAGKKHKAKKHKQARRRRGRKARKSGAVGSSSSRAKRSGGDR